VVDGVASAYEDGRHHLGWEQAVLHDARYGGQPLGQGAGVADLALVVGDDAAVGAGGDVA
jgi:hypothetical protein